MKQTSPWSLNDHDFTIINLALSEDLGQTAQDLTTDVLFKNQNSPGQAHILSKHPDPIVLCGLPIIEAVLAKAKNKCEIHTHYHDGNIITPGQKMITIIGQTHDLLRLERIILNFLQPLSAVATLTNQFVERIRHTQTRILDTRKTIPGWRHLQKYAVHCGGGVNHRIGLYDAIMIKDTHIDALGGIHHALKKLPNDILQHYPVIVEVRSEKELNIVLQYGQHIVSRVLLDNMTLPQLSNCVAMCRGYLATEASGNVDINTVVDIAECGVDFISIGKLTHSAGNVDLSMQCDYAYANNY